MEQLPIRLDKWLWAARFFKSRSLAQKSIANHKILIDNQKASPSRKILVGNFITIKTGDFSHTYEVMALSDKRESYTKAKDLYQETEQSILEYKNKSEKKDPLFLKQSPKPDTRPDKRARRKIRELKNKND